MAGEINAVGTVGTVTRRPSQSGNFYTMPITVNGIQADFSAWDEDIQKAEGSTIEFTYIEKPGAGGRTYRNIQKGWSFLPASQQQQPGSTVQVTNPNQIVYADNRQESIVRQSSLKAALEFMSLLSDNGALGISKTKAAKDPEVLMELCKQFAIQFKDFVDTDPWENIWNLPKGEQEVKIEGDDMPF